jgi:hypothetical protein
MAQLVVAPEELRDQLRKEGPLMLIKENALKPEQCCHHITLAFKPTCGELERLVKMFNNDDYTARFYPTEVRANPGICAVFGGIIRQDQHTLHTHWRYPGAWHITLGADEGVQPKESNKLLDDYTTCSAWERYPELPQEFGLCFNIVGF